MVTSVQEGGGQSEGPSGKGAVHGQSGVNATADCHQPGQPAKVGPDECQPLVAADGRIDAATGVPHSTGI
jgi:hypothetical protein